LARRNKHGRRPLPVPGPRLVECSSRRRWLRRKKLPASRQGRRRNGSKSPSSTQISELVRRLSCPIAIADASILPLALHQLEGGWDLASLELTHRSGQIPETRVLPRQEDKSSSEFWRTGLLHFWWTRDVFLIEKGRVFVHCVIDASSGIVLISHFRRTIAGSCCAPATVAVEQGLHH
jgi:hypothetical protein